MKRKLSILIIIILCVLFTMELCLLIKKNNATDRTLDLATYGITDNLSSIVERFENDYNMQINVRDYSAEDTGHSSGLLLLEEDLNAGIIDCIALDGLSYDEYIQSGLLLELDNYLQNIDGVEYILESVTANSMQHTYSISSGFNLVTILGTKGDLDVDKLGYIELISCMLAEGKYIDIMDSDFIYGSLRYFIREFYDNGVLNNESLSVLLQYACSINVSKERKESNYYFAVLPDFIELQVYENIIGQELDYYAVSLNFVDKYGIAKASDNPELAWKFISEVLEPEYQLACVVNGMQFPTNTDVLTQMAHENSTIFDEDPIKGYAYIDGEEIELYAATQDHIDTIYDMIDSALEQNYFGETNRIVSNIIADKLSNSIASSMTIEEAIDELNKEFSP